MEKYFSGLNYSLANEDNRIEKRLSVNSKRILAVCGSGTRALSLLSDKVQELSIVDISQAQLDYARFKYELIKLMSYEDYLAFIGLHESDLIQRISIFKKYQHNDWVSNYYHTIPKDYIHKGLIYSGRWESFLITLGRIITGLTGYENYLLDFSDSEHAKRFWPEQRLHFLINLLAHPRVLNHFLYKGQMIDLKENHLGDFLLNNFRKDFLEKNPKESFFLQLLFLGRIMFSEAYPLEFKEETFLSIKNYHGTINFICADLITVLGKVDFDFASLSNVATYFTTKSKEAFESQLLKVLLRSNTQKQVVMRSFLRPDRIQNKELLSYLDHEQSLSAEQQDSTLLYKFQILKKL